MKAMMLNLVCDMAVEREPLTMTDIPVPGPGQQFFFRIGLMQGKWLDQI